MYARFDPVRRVPSPAEGTALAERPSVLEVTANPMVNGLIVRALHGGHASDGRQGSVAFHERGGARVAAVCPSLLTDDPDAVDLRYERGGRTVTAAVRAPGVCEPRHRARRAGDTEAVRRRVAEHERVIFGYLRRVFAACTSGGRPALGALEALPGFVAARASCSLPGEAATRSWGDPIEPSLAADAELRGTYRPAQHRLVRWSVDPAQGLELLVARETRQDGAEAYAEIFIRTP
ncbi:MAG TPA: hypothetical protein RMH99_09300 [Sandaracinaceae bacterium LLY-WYZ-13_1]|nr:hypothetical protein [Sandaracinaceae bacterium LLY-WYZ-13_1]